jgi:GT2 family glycosyltransferase
MSAPHVAIILVNFHGHKDTVECLETVLKSEYSDFSIFIIDNSADDSSLNFIVEWLSGKQVPISTDFPELVYPLIDKPLSYLIISSEQISKSNRQKIYLFKAKENKGFAAANNEGILIARKIVKPDWFWLLNNDTVVLPQTLGELVTCANSSASRIGIIGSSLYRYFQRDKLQGWGGVYLPWIGKVKEVGKNKTEVPSLNSNISIDYAIGASMFVSNDFVNEVGLMEEKYFLYFEELDWSLNGRRNGWDTKACLRAKVYHKGGASTHAHKGNSKMTDFYYARNRILLARKFFPHTLPSLYISFTWFLIRRILKGQFDRIGMLFSIILKT